MEPPDSPRLTERFTEAVAYAFKLHQHQRRKGTQIPYITHLLSVTALVLEDGGDEDQAIAAMLHDAVEDQGGYVILEEIRARFGSRVGMIVEGCTDAYSSPKPPWRQRKEQYLEHLSSAPADVRRVSLADKLHNARSVLADLIHEGNSVWSRFNGKRDGTLWYYRELATEFDPQKDGRMAVELRQIVLTLQEFRGKENAL